jgi:hypothetical protein
MSYSTANLNKIINYNKTLDTATENIDISNVNKAYDAICIAAQASTIQVSECTTALCNATATLLTARHKLSINLAASIKAENNNENMHAVHMDLDIATANTTTALSIHDKAVIASNAASNTATANAAKRAVYYGILINHARS